MTKNSNRKGLALGAIFALIGSLFVSAPAVQANEAGLVVQPAAGTSFTMVNTEDFIITTRLGSQVQSDRIGALRYLVTKSGTVGYGLSISNSVSNVADVLDVDDWADVNDLDTVSSVATSSTTSTVITPASPTTTLGKANTLRIQLWSLSALTSASPAASVTVHAWLDLDGNGLINGSEPVTSVVVSFVSTKNMGASVVLTQPIAGDVWATASASISGINVEQLVGDFKLGFLSTNDGVTANASASASDAVSGSALALGTFSHSEAIAAATASVAVAQSISAVLYYGTPGDNTIVASQKLGVTNTATFDGFTFSGTVGDNFVYTGSSKNAADIRVNSAVALEAWAFTGSKGAVSATQATKWYFSTNASLSTDKYIVVNGVSYTDSAKLPTESTAVAVALGTKGAIALSTVGFVGNETITFNQKLGDKSAAMTLTVRTPDFSLVSDTGLFAVAAPGADSVFGFTVKDQFDVLSNRVNQRVAAYTFAASGFSTSTTVSSAVVAGKASVTVTTLPATATGSATVRATLQRQDENTGAWVNVTTTDIALVVTASSAIFKSAVSPTTSNVSISYDVWSWSDDITITTNVAGAAVTVEATGLVFNDVTAEVTASDKIVIRTAAAGVGKINVAGKKAGTYTISYTVGTTTTTSQIVIQPAVLSYAATVTVDKTTLVTGQTNTIVATLVDANGNPIETETGLVMTWAGKGLPFNVVNKTDEDGQTTFQVLVLAGETGTGALSVKISPTSLAKDDITVVRTFTIAAPVVVAPVVPEINAVIGTFQSRWAVRVENAKGATVTVKVGGNWFKYTSLNDNYLFSRKSIAGRTVAVTVWVNGELQNSQTITIRR